MSDYTPAQMREMADRHMHAPAFPGLAPTVLMLRQGADAMEALEERRLHDEVMLATLHLDSDTCTWKDVQPAVAMLLHRRDQISEALAAKDAEIARLEQDIRKLETALRVALLHP